MQKKLSAWLFKGLLVMIPFTALTLGYAWSVNALADKIYQDTAGQISFLAPKQGYVHKAITTNKLSQESIDLKALVGKTIYVNNMAYTTVMASPKTIVKKSATLATK